MNGELGSALKETIIIRF